MQKYNFGPASRAETMVYGARRPGESHRVSLQEALNWIEFMQQRGIRGVVCLLPEQQLADYPFDLLELYRQAFGSQNVCWAPSEDFSLNSREQLLEQILPFLGRSENAGSPVVVHCAGGIGRTARVLAAWLVYARQMTEEEALLAVQQTGAERNPFEGVGRQDLLPMLAACRD